MALGFFTDDNSGDSYESIQRKRKLADALLAQSQDGAPIQSWTQGGAKLIQALAGSLQNRSLDTKERESSKAFNETLMRALGGQSGGSMPSAAPSPMPTGGGLLPAMASGGNIPKMVMPDPVYGNLDATQKALLNAIAAPESAGAYNIRYTPKGGATFAGFDAHPGVFEPGPAGPSSAAGRYQFTKTTWDRMGGGEFTPENQDKRALALANQDYKARTGRDLMADIQANGFTPQIAQALGPTWRGLIDNPQKAIAAFQSTMQRNQQPPAQVAQAGMTPDGMPTTPVPSNAAPMSYAPGQQAIASAAPQQPAQGQRLAQAVTSPPIPAPQPTGNVQQAMMAVLSDPRFSPEQKRQAMQLYQMTQREQPKWEKLNDGTLYNPRTAETKGVGGGFKMLTDPNERARYGIAADDKRPYQIDPAGKLTGVGGSTTNVNVGGGSDKQIFDVLSESATAAKSAATGLNAIREARSAVEGGAILGAGADMRLGLAKVATALGVSDPSKVQNTETFRSAIAPQVAAMLKATVGSSQISNTDRDFAEKAAGGSITLDKGTILRLMDIMERGNLAVIQGHQERLDSVYDDPEKFKRERSLFGVKAPEARQAAPQSGQPVRVASPDEARKLPKGTKIILPDGREGVVP
jgi:muramidase (phage lysozyme)